MTPDQLMARFGRILMIESKALEALSEGMANLETQAGAAYRIDQLTRALREQAANQEKMRQALVAIWQGQESDPSVAALDALVDAKAVEAGTARAWAVAESRELTLVAHVKGHDRSDLVAQLENLKGDVAAGFVGGRSNSGDGEYRYAVRDTGSLITMLTKKAA